MSEDRQTAPDGQELPSTQTGEATHPSAGARLPGRRAFLLGTGGLAAAALVGPSGRWLGSAQPAAAGPASTQPVGSGSPLDVEARRARALGLRVSTAHQQLRDPFPQPQPNGDEARYANDVVGLANFTKALPHNPLGEVDPAVLEAHNIAERVAWLEVDLDVVTGLSRSGRPYRLVSVYPSSDIDLAFEVDDDVPATAVEATLREATGDRLAALRLFDVYRGPGIAAGRRSLAYSLRLEATDHTLTDDEVAEVRRRGISAVESAHAATLRG